MTRAAEGGRAKRVRLDNVNDFANIIQPVSFGRTASVDAFGRLRVSNPLTLHDAQFTAGGLLPQLYEQSTAGNGAITLDTDKSEVQLATDGANADEAIFQSRAYHRYQPGKSQLLYLTGNIGENAGDNLTLEIGYADANDGILFQNINGVMAITLRSSTTGAVTEDSYVQTSWNVDQFDGTGPSGITIDFTKSQLFALDLEWLSVGQVRTGFVIDGVLYYAHAFNNANTRSGAYMRVANLPIRYRIVNTAAGDAGVLTCICHSVISEGGFVRQLGFPFSASNGATTISVTTRRPILSIRPRATFNSLVNRARIIPEVASVYSEDAALFVEVVFGGALTNASFANLDATYSATEIDVAATAISGGIVIKSFIVAAGGLGANITPEADSEPLISRLPLALDISGSHPTSPLTDNLSIVATSVAGGATDVSASLDIRELQ